MQTLAVKYRPKTWDDVTEQEEIKIILQQQLKTHSIKNAYLFCGGAGTGKTTCARIFANEINAGRGNPIEMDAASNSSVEDVRSISQQARAKSIDSEYKIFIIDECHAISNTGWQAFLKLIEEPPAKSIFIFCTTDPQKIPKTILSRVQRYDFKRISQQGIEDRLIHILNMEDDSYDKDGSGVENDYWLDALAYIAKIADGGMRDAISLMDKCLSYSKELTLENVVKALGTVDYQVMMDLTDKVITGDVKGIVDIIEDTHREGKDIKQFISQYTQFVLDVVKFGKKCPFDCLQLPKTGDNVDWLESLEKEDYEICEQLLKVLISLSSDVKYSQTPKYDFEAKLILLGVEDE